MKVLIVACALFIVTMSVGLLVFGDNFVTMENAMIEHVNGSVKTDMLMATPEGETKMLIGAQ